MQNTVIKLTPTQLEDELVDACIAMKNRGLTSVTRDFLWNYTVMKFGTTFGKDGKPVGPGGQVMPKKMMVSVANRISAVYKDTSTRNRYKIVF